jgi:hypothetical protein
MTWVRSKSIEYQVYRIPRRRFLRDFVFGFEVSLPRRSESNPPLSQALEIRKLLGATVTNSFPRPPHPDVTGPKRAFFLTT